MIGIIVFVLFTLFLLLGIVTYIRHSFRAKKDVLTGSELYLTNLIAVQFVNPKLLESDYSAIYASQIDKVYPYLGRKILQRSIKDMADFASNPALAQNELANFLLNKSDEERALTVARGIKLTAIVDESNYFSEQLVTADSDVNINYCNILSILKLNNEQVKTALKREDL